MDRLSPDYPAVRELLLETLKCWHVDVPGDLCDRLERYADTLVEWNRHTNLTSIVEPHGIWMKHFLDSLSCLTVVDAAQTCLIDIGSGAGFPGMVLAMARKEWQVVLLDAARKRVDFLKSVAEMLGADNVQVIHARAEDAARDSGHREAYDWAVARGVADLRILAEYTLPFVNVGGTFLAMKGPSYQNELSQAGYALELLGGSPGLTHELELPEESGRRSLITIRKNTPTPDIYPRRAGKVEKNPLQR